MFGIEQACLCVSGRLHHSAKMYGEIFVNGKKSRLPYGAYVSSKSFESNLFICFSKS